MKKKNDDIEQKVIFVFDETPTDETYEDFVAKYIALLHKWDKRQKQNKCQNVKNIK